MKGAEGVSTWLVEPLPRDVELAIRRIARSDDVRRVAVMPDVHLSAEVCVGTVVATRDTLYPNAVGGDVGCGVAALAFDAEAGALSDATVAARVLAGLRRAVPIIRRRRREASLPEVLASRTLSAGSLEAAKRREAALQHGTLGRGNHFVELQADTEDRLWLMLHSGSRAIGQAIRDHHLRGCRASGSGLRGLPADSPEGRAYRNDVEWALEYAETGRRRMADAVAALLGDVLGIEALPDSWVSCHHNHVRREAVGGETLWVHRKGAMPARAGEPGLIPGSMGTRSYHVEGRGCAEALCSSAHGAGRRLSRTEARRAFAPRDVEREMRRVWFDRSLASGLREEAPSAYKDVDAVMRAQRDLVRVVRRLRPILVFKGA